MIFAWGESNIEHLSKHAVRREEAEYIVRHAKPPWPEQKGDDKLLVWGATRDARLLQVIFTLKSPDQIEFDELTIDEWAELGEDDRVVYVIHAMDMTIRMKKLYRKKLQP